MKREIIRNTKTQETFKRALAVLLEKHSILDISTMQVCQQADMNRSTFYAKKTETIKMQKNDFMQALQLIV